MKRLFFILILTLACAAAPARAQTDSELLKGYSFCWGAQVGGSIDMSEQNMSTIDLSATVGMRHAWIKMLGIGVGADIMVSNSCRNYPLFVTFRTDFSSRCRKLLFMDTRLGIANNTFPGEMHRTGFYGYGGLGINLAKGRRFASFITIGYSFVQRGDMADGDETVHLPHLHYASVALGVSF